ncbi:universal stress protein UspA and related nucleotide-binding proteins [Pelotomaculum thermopropionicum SI]|uniref:Universal stress protein UspA and related nucleotide-binding proteins n=1 Tax=Pelotomaculum thermopropionicum (strain DSM 13744 / JCM 10971 / SI) TaxID=370438 RepID=A5D040_PELTS|nr:universal stress protein UspA and related nucleotide-binding proteins [Pelotomaculum thermopropionicum SI]
MAGGFYICGMIGSPSTSKYGDEDPYRPYIDNYPVNYVCAAVAGKGALVYVSNPTPEMEADPKIHRINKAMDDTLTRSEWNFLVNKLKGLGLNPNEYNPKLTVREAIIWIGTQYNPAFDIDHFHVA